MSGLREVLVHLHLDWGRSPRSWQKMVDARRVWDADPYGYSAMDCHVRLSYSEDREESAATRLTRRVLGKVIGMDIIHAWRNRQALSRAQVVVTHTEHEFLAVLMLMRVRAVSAAQVVCQAVWLWDRWDRLSWLRRRLFTALMRQAAVLTVLSTENLDVARTRSPGVPVTWIPFGVRPIPASPPREGHSSTLRILAAGNDRDRDWPVLAQASVDAPFEVRVRSRRRAARRSFPKSAGVVRPATSIDEYWADLEWCDVVVVPLLPNLHASGVTVTLEAISAGRPVVVADVGGLRSYFADHVYYYTAGDPASLVDAVRRAAARGVLAHSSADDRPFLSERGLRAEDYARRHVLLIEALLNRSPVPDAVSSLEVPQLSRSS